MLELSQLQRIVAFATDRTSRSSFYRNHYSISPAIDRLQIDSLEAFQQLPQVTKDDLLSMHLFERIFIPLSEVTDVLSSTGTSKTGLLFSAAGTTPMAEFYSSYYHYEHGHAAAAARHAAPRWLSGLTLHQKNPLTFVTLDPLQADISAKMVKEAKIDSIGFFVQHARIFGEALKKAEATKQIRFIIPAGENCSEALLQYLENTFPNAKIVQIYGANENEEIHIATACKSLNDHWPAVYHPQSSYFLEIVDPETRTPLPIVPGQEGDILITAYTNPHAAFPLIRYAIGDRIRIEESPCPHAEWSFSVIGRSNLDFLKITAGVLRSDEVVRVLRKFPDLLSDEFELHLYDKPTNSGPKPQIILAIERKNATPLESIAFTIARLLRVNPERTYQEAVSDDYYLPLICIDLQKKNDSKSRRMHNHMSL